MNQLIAELYIDYLNTLKYMGEGEIELKGKPTGRGYSIKTCYYDIDTQYFYLAPVGEQ